MPIDPAVRRVALSCLLLGFVGPTPPDWLLGVLADGLGGVVLFGSNLGDGSDVASLTDRLRAAAGRDILIALDEEGGDVTRLDTQRGSSSPGAAALGELDEEAATEEVYAAIGVRLAAAGVTVNLAPVADVNIDPLNPVIGVRSFSADPATAARHVAAAVRGIQRTGVAACVKHFPGHGATAADSHHEAVILDRSRAQVRAVELEPFRAAIAAGTRAVMTAHMRVPVLDPVSLATVSSSITTDLLRHTLGFPGTILTDALEMRALAGTMSLAEGFVRAVGAGADAIETGAMDYPSLVEEIPGAVEEALRTGQLTIDRLAAASRRTAELAAAGDPTTGYDEATAAGAAARCVETIGTLPALHAALVVECRPAGGMASGALPWSLAERLSPLLPGTDVLSASGPLEESEVLGRAAGRSLIVVVRDPSRHGWQQSLIQAARRHPAAVVVDVGWPSEYEPGVPLVRTRGVAPGLLAAAAELLAAPRP